MALVALEPASRSSSGSSIMSYRNVCGLSACWFASAACVLGDHPAARADGGSSASAPEYRVPPGYRVPKVDETLCVKFEAATLPSWLVQDSRGDSHVTREIRLAKGRSVLVLVTGDREGSFRIPAMRVDAAVVPDRYQTAWFTPLEAGVYEILVRSGAASYDGKLIVEDAQTPSRETR
ncbi:MAG TPA: hypothetical protein VF384_19875 [Planctomycetota bacterium]